jgi:6-phosphogluconolactonase (cycloisomerase 2 family)/cell wall-associated NlpC family hydrolase
MEWNNKQESDMKELLKSIAGILLVILAATLPSFCQLQQANTFVYVNNDIDSGPNSISAFTAQSDGSLKKLTDLGSPFQTGGTGGGIMFEDSIAIVGTFLYAANNRSNDISGFSIDPVTGALVLRTDPPVPSGLTFAAPSSSISLAATPDGRFLYVWGYSSNNIVTFHIELNGALTNSGSKSVPAGPAWAGKSLKVSPDGRFLAVGFGNGQVTIFSISSEGALFEVGQVVTGLGVNSLDFNCGSNLLLVPFIVSSPGSYNGVVAVFALGTDGTWGQIKGSPFPFDSNGAMPLMPLLSPDDLHLFVSFASTILSNIASLNITPGGGGAITQTNSSISIGQTIPIGMALDQPGTHLYVIGALSPKFVTVYKIDPAGVLTQVQPSASHPTPVLLPTGARSPWVAVYPPKTCFGNLAAQQAQKDAGGLYGEGGKGFDFSGWGRSDFPSPSDGNQCEFQPANALVPATAPCWITPSSINSEYWYVDSNPGYDKTPNLDYGMDCSGLVMWSYNTAVNATGLAQAPGSPAAGTDAKLLPIWYEGAGAQCSASQSTLIANDILDSNGHTKTNYQHPLDLRPGDLLCFHYSNGTPGVNHVAMYLGNQAIQTGQDTTEDYLRSSIPAHNGVVPGNVDTRPFSDVADRTNCSSPTPASPCFNFEGFWRPMQPRAAILWQAHSPVSLRVTDPDGYRIDANTWVVGEHEAYRAAGSLFYNDYSPTGDDMVFSPTLKPGTYLTQVVPKTGAAPTDTYSLTVTTPGSTITLAENVPLNQIPPLGYGIESNGTRVGAFIPVAIDIKPGCSPKAINPKSDGTIPVAILSSTSFNALTEVARKSLTFGRTGNEQSLAFCDIRGMIVNRDRLPDLLCHFNTKKTGFQAGDTQGVLKGLTVGGQPLRGAGSVQVVLKRWPKGFR